MSPDEWPLARALRGEIIIDFEMRLRQRDTGHLWFASVSPAPIPGECGTIPGAVGSTRDVTENRRVEEVLRRSESRFRTLHQTLGDGFVQVAITGQIIDVNEIFGEIFRYTAVKPSKNTLRGYSDAGKPRQGSTGCYRRPDAWPFRRR